MGNVGLQSTPRGNPGRDALAEVLHAIIEEEYKSWRLHGKIEPLPWSLAEKIVVRVLGAGSEEARRTLNILIANGFLVEKNGGLQSFVFEYAHKFTDLRKYTGYCSQESSEMRTLGFDLRLCRLGLPDFNAVPARRLIKSLEKYGNLGTMAAVIAEVWWPSYSREQAEIIESLVSSLAGRKTEAYLVDMPTGSGKTEAFVIPALANAASGGLSIIVYPRRALASDQLRRLIELYTRLKDVTELPLVDVYDGDSCPVRKEGVEKRCKGSFDRVPVLQLDKPQSAECQLLYDNGGARVQLKCRTPYTVETMSLPLTDMRLEHLLDKSQPPRVLITTYDTLNLLLSAVKKRSMADLLRVLKPERIMLVFDEAHEFQGPDFMHLILLVARFLLTVRSIGALQGAPVTLVFSSATLPQGFDKIMETMLSRILGARLTLRVLPSAASGGRERSILVATVAPDPETAGQWLYQLGLFALTSFSLARKRLGAKPFKTIAFVDSLRYQWEIYNRTISTLFDAAQEAIGDHVPPTCGNTANPADPLDWSTLFKHDPRIATDVAKELTDPSMQRYRPQPGGQGSGVLAIHHAGLRPQERQALEADLKRGDYPVSVVSTSTLEMGVDIPSVANIMQFRKPRSEASMMQRIGRAARSSDTLYTGYAAVVLTNLPSDALLLLDEDTLNRYLYGCRMPGYTNPPKPQVKAPANKMILLNHLFLTALSHNPSLAQALRSIPSELSISPDMYASQARRLVESKRQELEKIAAAVIEAYSRAEIHGMKYSPASLVDEIISDLKTAEEALAQGIPVALKQRLKALAEEAKKLAHFVGPGTSTSITLSLSIARCIMRGLFTELMTKYSAVVCPAIASNVASIERISREDWFRRLYNLLSDIENLIDNIISHLRVIDELAEKNIADALRSLRDAKNYLEELQSHVSEVSSLVEGEAAILFCNASARQKLINELDILANEAGRLLGLVNEAVRELDARQRIREGGSIYELLAVATGKPYFTPYIRQPPLRVAIRMDCGLDTQTMTPTACRDRREDSPVSALYRIVPLSEGGERDEPTYTFLPPGGEDRATVKAVGIAYNPRNKGYFVKEVYYDELMARLVQAQLGSAVANVLRGRIRRGVRGSRVRASLGDAVREATILSYSAIAKLIADSMYYADHGRKGRMYNPWYVAFVFTPMRDSRYRLHDIRVMLRVGMEEQGRIVPYRPAKGLPVGYCPRSRLVIIGIDTAAGKQPGPLFRQDCPLRRIYDYFSSETGAGSRYAERVLETLKEICPYVDHERKCPRTVLCSDVYTHMLRAKPMIGLFLEPGAGRGSPSTGVVQLNVMEAKVEYRYSWLRLEIRAAGEELIYPLPVRFNAPIYRTYTAIVNINRTKINEVIAKMSAWAGSTGGKPLLIRWLALKTILAAAGVAGKSDWDKLSQRLVKAVAGNDNVEVQKVLHAMALRAKDALRSVLKGQSFIMSTSGVRRGAKLLFDIAVEGLNTGIIYDAFASLIARGDPAVEDIVRAMAELTLAHTLYYAVASINGYDDVVKLYRAFTGASRGASTYSYVLVEEKEGGVGFLPTITSGKLADDLRKALKLASKAMGDIYSGREGAQQRLAARQRKIPIVAKYRRLVEDIALRVAEAYGATTGQRGARRVIHTFLPAWLARTVLTADKLRDYARKLNYNIKVDEQEWNVAVAELLPAYFDADFPDAPVTHIGGVDSWLGEYEKRLLQSTLLAQLFYAHI